VQRRPRGTGRVYRPKYTTANGETKEQSIWWLAYHVGGKLKRENSGTTVKSDAEKLLRARTAAIDRGELTDAAALTTTLSELGDIVQTDYVNNGRTSVREVARCFKRLQKHFGVDCLARKITSARVEEYKAARLKQGARHATINRELAMLRRGLRLGVRLGKVATRPEFSLLRENNARSGFFELEQFKAVLSQLPDYLRPLASFLYWTGWRKSEALSLEWREVDLKAGVIRIEKTKNSEQRTIPYSALPELNELIEAQRDLTTRLEREKSLIIPWVFHRRGGRILAFMGAWHSACARAGLAGRIPHDFRRTAARAMIRAGIPQAVAMKIGGWKTDSVFRRYAIVDEKLLAENLRKLSARPDVK
jgi:integrase